MGRKIFPVDVCRVGLGTMGFGGRFSFDKSTCKESKDALLYAYDLGIRVVDTAEVYGDGASEKILGELPTSVKNNFFLMSKFSAHHESANSIESALDSTLKRLSRDYVDVYQPHWPLKNIELCDLIPILLSLKAKGKVRYIGLSNYTHQSIKDIGVLAEEIDFFQNEYSPLARGVENTFLNDKAMLDSYLVAHSPFSEGKIFNQKIIMQVSELCPKYDASTAQLILAWLMRYKNLIVIPKSINKKRIYDNFNATKLNIEKSDLDLMSNYFSILPEFIPPRQISMGRDVGRTFYTNLDDAVKNVYNLSPSPNDIVIEILNNGCKLSRPIKVRKLGNQKYELTEGRLKYWAWVIIHGYDEPIESILVD